MENPLLQESLDLYSSLYERLLTIPISWDKRRRRFVYNLNHKRLIFWYLGLILMLLGTISCFYVFARRILSKTYLVPWFIALLDGFIGFMGSFGNNTGDWFAKLKLIMI